MSVFFECCVRCRKTFTNEVEFKKHMDEHRSLRKVDLQKPIQEISEAESNGVKLTNPVLSESNVESRLESVKGINVKRKRLINAGIEASTMTPSEVETRYNTEKAKGKVK